MADQLNEASLRQQLVDQYKYVERIGLNELESGNLSVRIGDQMLISASGASADNISAATIVKMSFEGEREGDHEPSSEWRMHAAIYQQNKETLAIVHTHSDYCVALSCQLLPLPGFHYLVGLFGGDDVPCVPYSTFGSQALGDDAAEALTNRTACLLGSHGMIARGPDLKTAVNRAQRLEIMCRQYILARQLGEPRLLTDKQWVEFFERAALKRYGQSS